MPMVERYETYRVEDVSSGEQFDARCIYRNIQGGWMLAEIDGHRVVRVQDNGDAHPNCSWGPHRVLGAPAPVKIEPMDEVWRIIGEDAHSGEIPYIDVGGELGNGGTFAVACVEADLDDDEEFVLTKEAWARARLIAAAPDLLRAAQAAREQILRMGGDGHASGLDAALAKATDPWGGLAGGLRVALFNQSYQKQPLRS